jgi:small subunit ribosomal protein S20
LPAEKSARVSQRRRIVNRNTRSSTRTRIATALDIISQEDKDQATEAVKRAIQGLDRAAKKGVIHKNNASRRKSRLMKRLNVVSEKSIT